MLKHYFNIAFRNIRKNKVYSVINVLGLGIGLACTLVILLWVRHEMSYDKHYANKDRLYRVIVNMDDDGDKISHVYFQAPFAKALLDEFPEIEKAGKFNSEELFGAGKNLFRRENTLSNAEEDGFAFADQGLLDVLEIPVIEGEAGHMLEDPNAIVITKKIANKYFPNEEAVGKTIILNDDRSYPYVVKGVIEDFPDNSHLDFNFFIALHPNIFYSGEQNNWLATNYPTYILVKPGTNIQLLEEKLDYITTKYLVPAYQSSGSQSLVDFLKSISYSLQPIEDIHLRSAKIEDGMVRGDIRIVYLFSALAIFILLIACINFINLSTAKSMNRDKEVGLKKTIGAGRGNIIRQFLLESVIYSFLAVITGLILTQITLPYFNILSSKSLSVPWHEWWTIPLFCLLPLVLGIIAGIYPSLYLSRFKPVAVMRGHGKPGRRTFDLRSGLVIFQFASTIILIIVTITIYRQMDYILSKNLGFDKEQVLLLRGTNILENKTEVFKEEVKKLPDIVNVSVSDYLPIKGTLRNGNSFYLEGKENRVSGQHWVIDYDYIDTYSMKIIEGRNFSKDMPSDEGAAIINKQMAKELNLNDPIGKRLTNSSETWNIIGVVDDFHFETMDYEINPVCLVLGNSPKYMSVKVSGTNLTGIIHSIEKLWSEFAPNQPFQYSFLDSEYQKMYKNVDRQGQIFLSFAILAIIVACLGLFGLAELTTKERTKEIGVRKVNGARIDEILLLLNTRIVSWILIAIVIGCPIAWYGIDQWLINFAYRIDINWWVFVFAGLISLSISLITVSWHSWKAASKNPVDALRYE